MAGKEPITSTSVGVSRQSVHRRALDIARALMIYGLLFGGAAVFSIPFVWMIGTSLKVDREMFGDTITLLPQAPIPAATSPHLDGNYFRVSRHEMADRIEPWVLDGIRNVTLPPESALLPDADVAHLLFPGVYRKLRDIMPTDHWQLPDDSLRREVESRISSTMVEQVFRAIYRPLVFSSIRVRSFDLQEKELTTDRPISEIWALNDDAPARMIDDADAVGPFGVLAYDFSGPGHRDSVRLSTTLTLPFAAERLFRIQLSIVPDDSWHRLDFAFERNGVLYRGMRPAYLGDNQAMVITLQEYGPEDQSHSGKIRLWYAAREVDRGSQYESRPDHVKVIVTMTESSSLQAWWAKGYRNYRGALNYIPFGRYVATSAFLVILNIVGTLFSCSLVAYAFARLQWPGRQFSFALMMATMMIPPQVTMIPYFLIIKHLGWYNTLNPLWVVSFFGNAFNIFLLRQFMKGIPRDLEDAARIDGCNFMQVYWHVILPLIKPTLACIAIFTFMGVWNDFMGPLIYLADQPLYPLSLGLYALNVQEGGNYGMMMAGSFLMTLPVVVIFFFAQKYFIQGVTLTGMKG
ncbi:MAG TPA: carbohydrate ABC transporter permease [Kiritimatiellia bacterium]|nr:carbohydrate ABC transporter permease [Kiritimatiellia bacterium]HMO98593.1 carbohydrate ABC transporter permease [Kiritimatiellia bacterium]HMP95428.1 carbohydrate ABC transporter permease [Kiritimatiellia bacterium]